MVVIAGRPVVYSGGETGQTALWWSEDERVPRGLLLMLHRIAVYLFVFVCILVRHDLLVNLRGAYNEQQVIATSKNNSLVQTLSYYINKNLENELGLWTVRADFTVQLEKLKVKELVLNSAHFCICLIKRSWLLSILFIFLMRIGERR